MSTQKLVKEVFVGRDVDMTEEEIKERLDTLSYLKIHPRDREAFFPFPHHFRSQRKRTYIGQNHFLNSVPALLHSALDSRFKERLDTLSYLKIHPRDREENKYLLLRGERIYEESLGERRMVVEAALHTGFSGRYVNHQLS